MKRKIQKIHESFLVTIPKEYADDLKLKEGDKLDFRIEGKNMIVMPVAPSCKTELQTATHEHVNAIPTSFQEVKSVSVT